MTEPSKPRIFLCHASEDKPQVKKLYQQLKAAGYHPWLDQYDLLPGQDWRREIRKIITEPYNLVVICLSSKSTTKRGVVQQEIKWALDILDQMPEDTIYLIPARLEPCQTPDRLSSLHWVNLFEPDGFEYLMRALNFETKQRQKESKPELQIPEVIESKSDRIKTTPKPSESGPQIEGRLNVIRFHLSKNWEYIIGTSIVAGLFGGGLGGFVAGITMSPFIASEWRLIFILGATMTTALIGLWLMAGMSLAEAIHGSQNWAARSLGGVLVQFCS